MDIDHLKHVGKVDSFPVTIDSSTRDMRVYPTPAEYEIEFDTPFANVVGFDVLDATIPNTMYYVDVHNRRLSFAVEIDPPVGPEGRPMDAYLSDLMSFPEFVAVWQDARYSTLRIKFSGSLLDRTDLVLSSSPGPGTPVVMLDRVVELVPAVVSSYDPDPDAISIDPGTEHLVTTDGVRVYVETFSRGVGGGSRAVRTYPSADGGGNRVLVSATIPDSKFGTRVCYATMRAVDMVSSSIGNRHRMHFPKVVGGELRAVSAYEAHRVDESFFAAMTNAPKADVVPVGQTPSPSNPYNLEQYTYHSVLELHNLDVDMGNHDIPSFVAALKFAMPTYVPSPDASAEPLLRIASTSLMSDAAAPDYERQRRLRFESPHRFWMDMEKSTIREVLGFGEMASTGPAWSGGSGRVFEAKSRSAAGNLYALETPGLITLAGERMVVLRCPQIEEHAFPSLSHGRYSAGLGVFKLYQETFSHLRFDFTKLRRLDFHPIGRLRKMLFRFERLNGEPYNFKGVDHHLFVSIKFLVPKNERTLPPPNCRLNPDYDPDALRYEVERRVERDESDTESDDELIEDMEHRLRYYEQRRRFILEQEMRAA
jgi:hypothetical protein